MAYSTINKSTDHFNPKTYSGNDSTSHAITGVGHQPDLVWLKRRNGTNDHQWQDSVRGKSGSNYYYIQSNNTNTQGVQPDDDGVNTFGTDGFTVGHTNSGAWNESGANYISYNWKAGNSAGSSNSDGSITSTVSVNTTGGFSIVKYTGTGSNATVGHGLGVVPKMIIVKNYDATQPWWVYTSALGATKQLRLNDNHAEGSDGNVIWNSTAPTSSVFSVGTNTGSNGSGNSIIAYCFAEKIGHSKFGSYTGTGSSDGAFVYTGFKPSFVMVKQTDSADNWAIWDNKRETFNEQDNILRSDTNAAETSNAAYKIDLFSNGFKLRGTDTKINGDGNSYIYMAFGQTLVGTNNVPCNAR